jgi:glycosyltransferase involved in cell wall biosynthesis
MAVQKLTVAVPVYNERERVGRALKELLSTPLPVESEVIVVDDGSTDGTWEELQQLSLPEHVRLLRHPRNRGKGAALRTALEVATGDVFVPFDADLEYDPADLPGLLQPLIRGETDVVYGTRAFGSHTSYSFWYVVGNKLLALWANILFNCYISDLETCFKMARTDVLRSLGLRARSFDIEAEVTAKLLRAGYRPHEVPIRYKARTREQGKKISWRDGLVALWVVARIRFLGR